MLLQYWGGNLSNRIKFNLQIDVLTVYQLVKAYLHQRQLFARPE